jgi:hypothetical protein
VVVALAAGVAFVFVIIYPGSWSGWDILWVLMPFLVGIVSGGLLRSWWALLIMPVVFGVELFLGTPLVLDRLGQMPFNTAEFYIVDFAAALVGVVLFAPGVAIGTPIGKLIEKRLRH